MLVNAHVKVRAQAIAAGSSVTMAETAKSIQVFVADQCGTDPEMQNNALASLVAKAGDKLPARDIV